MSSGPRAGARDGRAAGRGPGRRSIHAGARSTWAPGPDGSIADMSAAELRASWSAGARAGRRRPEGETWEDARARILGAARTPDRPPGPAARSWSDPRRRDPRRCAALGGPDLPHLAGVPNASLSIVDTEPRPRLLAYGVARRRGPQAAARTRSACRRCSGMNDLGQPGGEGVGGPPAGAVRRDEIIRQELAQRVAGRPDDRLEGGPLRWKPPSTAWIRSSPVSLRTWRRMLTTPECPHPVRTTSPRPRTIATSA